MGVASPGWPERVQLLSSLSRPACVGFARCAACRYNSELHNQGVSYSLAGASQCNNVPGMILNWQTTVNVRVFTRAQLMQKRLLTAGAELWRRSCICLLWHARLFLPQFICTTTPGLGPLTIDYQSDLCTVSFNIPTGLACGAAQPPPTPCEFGGMDFASVEPETQDAA